jgi:hypothetical protein
MNDGRADTVTRQMSQGLQNFYSGLREPREMTHDSQVYRAYLRQ